MDSSAGPVDRNCGLRLGGDADRVTRDCDPDCCVYGRCAYGNGVESCVNAYGCVRADGQRGDCHGHASSTDGCGDGAPPDGDRDAHRDRCGDGQT